MQRRKRRHDISENAFLRATDNPICCDNPRRRVASGARRFIFT